MNPRLHALPPQRGRSIDVVNTPFWFGSGTSADFRVDSPAVRGRHVAIIERSDGFWLVRGEGDARIRGVSIASGVRLEVGTEFELAPGCSFRFGDAPVSAPPPRPTPLMPTRRSRRPLRDLLPSWHLSPKVTALLVAAVIALAASGVLIYRAVTAGRARAGELTIEQALVVDSLMRESYDRIERGNALLEIGGGRDAALREFADAVNVVQLHPLHTHPAVARLILQLEGTVASLYRERRMAVPPSFANAPTAQGPAGAGLKASLSTSEFSGRFREVQVAYQRSFGDTLVITGRDHAEHLSLYGQGGAIDLRSRDLDADRVRFIVNECLRRGIRVKDFTTDAILRAQVAAAVSAGLADRAGTGLHLHIDRFAGRRDRWTVPGP